MPTPTPARAWAAVAPTATITKAATKLALAMRMTASLGVAGLDRPTLTASVIFRRIPVNARQRWLLDVTPVAIVYRVPRAPRMAKSVEAAGAKSADVAAVAGKVIANIEKVILGKK